VRASGCTVGRLCWAWFVVTKVVCFYTDADGFARVDVHAVCERGVEKLGGRSEW
jgi:hypothetical protein